MNEETKGLPVVAWLSDADALADRLEIAGWRSCADAQSDGVRALLAEWTEAIAQRDAELAELREQNECLRMQLVACGVVALANTPDSAAKARDMNPDYWSASCGDVVRAVDAEMAIRAERDALQAELAAIRAAAVTVLTGLNERIDHAVANRLPTPIFEGIAALHDAVNAAPVSAPSQVAAEVVRPVVSPSFPNDSRYTYCTTQATECAGCGVRKHTPLRVDWMGGYVCLTCIDNQLDELNSAEDAEVVQVPRELAQSLAKDGDVIGDPNFWIAREKLRALLATSQEQSE